MEKKNYYAKIRAVELECLADIKALVAEAGGKIEFTNGSIAVSRYDSCGEIYYANVNGVYIEDDLVYADYANGNDFLVDDIANNEIIMIYNEVSFYTQK
jgi:hypothetical protein